MREKEKKGIKKKKEGKEREREKKIEKKKKRWNTCEPSTTNPDSLKKRSLTSDWRVVSPSELLLLRRRPLARPHGYTDKPAAP